MTSNDRHASHNSPFKTGQHVPLNSNRNTLSSISTIALDSRQDLNSPYADDPARRSRTGFQPAVNGHPGSPGSLKSPTSPYSPGMRSQAAAQHTPTTENNPFENVQRGDVQLQSFQGGLPPPPPVSHSWKRIDAWAEKNYPELFDQLAEGATNNDLNELEHQLDCSLPLEVRESLQTHDGQERGGLPTGIIFSCMLLDCEEIAQEWENWRKVNSEYFPERAGPEPTKLPKAFGSGAGSSSSMAPLQQSGNPLWREELQSRQDSQPPNAVQRVYAHPGWIPLARDWGGNNIAVDLAPGPTGKWGQIIIFGRDYDCKYVVARSWSAFLAMVADDLQSEKWWVDEDTNELKLKEFKTNNVEPGYLDILRWRMDQKYGRRGAKRKPPTGINTQRSSSPRGSSISPYASPTSDVDPSRGRSTHRFSGGPSSGSPRPGGVGKPSPLSRVTEEGAAPIKVVPTETKLVDLSTPRTSDEKKGQRELEGVMEAVGLDGDPPKSPPAKGLGVQGINNTPPKQPSDVTV